METNRFYVYCHKKKTDGKCFYVGKGCGTRSIQKTNRNQYWKNIVNKHGLNSEILINNITEEMVFKLESYFIRDIGLENLANFREEQGTGGFSHSDETKSKISKSMTGKKASQETKEKMRKPKPKGFGDQFRNREVTWGDKISKSRKGKGCKVVYQYDTSLNLIASYPSTKHASVAVDVHQVNLINNLNGKSKKCKGYIFKYIML